MNLDPKVTREDIIRVYDAVMKGIEVKAKGDSHRAYGGVVRMTKGKMFEEIASHMVSIAWKELGGDFNRISLDSRKIPIPIHPDYLNNLPSEISRHIKDNIDKYIYRCGVDLHVFVDQNFVLGIECKAYAENAMMKRILVDFNFLKSQHPNMNCMLLQLESQLTGDYNAPTQEMTYGSYSTHTLMSHFPNVSLAIVTLLEGERNVNKPIHKYYKPLQPEILNKGIRHISEALATVI